MNKVTRTAVLMALVFIITALLSTAAIAKPPEWSPDMVEITFVNSDNRTIRVPENTNLLRASIREKGGIPFKCGGGICGTCKCRIEEGLENTDTIKPKERRHLKAEDFEAGYRMACQTFVLGDVRVSW